MATTSRFVAKNGLDNNSKTLLNIGSSGSELSFSGGHSVTFTSTGSTGLTLPTSGTLAILTDIKDGTLTLNVSGNGLSGSASFSANTTSNVTFTVASNATSLNSSSTVVFRDSSGNFSANTITANLTGNVSGNATNVTGTVAIANGGTGASTATTAIINLGASTTGASLFSITPESAIRFIKIKADNTAELLNDSDFRAAIGAGTGNGTVTTVGLSLPNIFSLTTSSISTSGTLTATLVSQNANYVFAGPTTGSATTPAFRALVEDDIPSLLSLYAPKTVGSSILYADGSGGFSNVTIGTSLSFSAGNLSNSAPDLTVVLNASGSISITGTYPEFTISGTDTNTTYTNGTGLNLVGTTFSINTSVVTLTGSQNLINKTIGTTGLIFDGTTSGTTKIIASSAPSSNILTFPTSTGTLAITDDIKDGTLTLSVSGNGLSGTASFSANTTSNVTFTVDSNATSLNSSSTIVFRDSSGNFSANTITANLTGNVSGNATNVTGTVLIANGGTGATTQAAARVALGATTVGANLFTLTNPSAITFIRINADNSVSTLNSSAFRTAIGAGTGNGTVTNVSLSLPNIFTLTTSSVTTSGTLTALLASQNANTIFAGPATGTATTPTFRSLVANDIPPLNYAPLTSGTSILYGNGTGGFSSVNVGSGLSFSGGTLSNSSPDQTVTLNASTNVTITGTYPTFTISATDTNTTYTNGTGIDLVGTTFSINTSTVATLSDSQTLANKTIGTGGLIFAGTTSGTSLIVASSTPSGNTLTLPTSSGTIAITSDINNASLTLAVSGVGLTGSASFSANASSNATFTVVSNATSSNTVSTIVSRDASGNFNAGTITANLSGNATNVTGIVAIANGGTNASTAAAALTNLGATTVGANLFKLTDPNSTSFITINSANTVSARSASEFRSDLGATTVGSALFTLSNPGSTSFIRINADNTVTAQSASNFRADLGANTVGSNIFTLSNPGATTFIRINSDNTVTARSASDFRTDLGVSALGDALFTLSTTAIRYIQISTTSVNLLTGAAFRTAIGAGTGNGTVTSVDLSMPNIFTVSNNPVTTSGTLTVTLANQNANTVLAGPTTGAAAAPTFRALTFTDISGDALTVGKGGTGTSSLTSNAVLVGTGTSAVTLTATSSQYKVFVSGSGGTPTWGTVSLDQAAAISGKLPIASGGTNASTAAEALTNLGALSSAINSTQDGYFNSIYLLESDTNATRRYLQIVNFDNLSTSRTLNIKTNDGDRTLTIAANSEISGTNTGDQTITLTGDVTGSGTTSFAATLSTSGVTAGTYNNSTTSITPFTVDSKGRITSTGSTVTLTPSFSSITSKPTTLSGYGITDALSNSTSSTQSGYFGNVNLYDTTTNPSNYLQILNIADLSTTRTLSINTGDFNRTIILSGDTTLSGTNTGDQTITLTGDVTGSGTSSFAATLAASGVTAGTYNNSTTSITPFTVDSKGRITSIGVASTISPAFSNITSKPTTLSGYGITDALSNSTSSTQNAYFGDIHLRDDTLSSHYLKITDSENLTEDRTLNLSVNNENRTISLSGNLTVSTTSIISGTNSGDQTITLTGDVTGSGTSSFAATISSNAITFAKIVNSNASGLSVVGRNTDSAGNFGEIIAATDHQILRRSGTSIGFGSINLASSATVGTSVLSVTNGGTGVSSFVTSRLLISNSLSTTGVIETSANIIHSTSNLLFSPHGVSAGNTFELRFGELSGSEYIGLKAPDSITTSYTYVLPSSAPTSGQVLSASAPTSGVVTLSWANDASGSGSGTVSAGDQYKLAYYKDSNGSTVVDDATYLTYSSTGPHLLITAGSTTATPLVLKGIASQSDPLMKITNSSDASLVTISSTGILTLSNSTAASSTSTGALVVTGGIGVSSDSYLEDVYVTGTSLVASSATTVTLGTTSSGTATIQNPSFAFSGTAFTASNATTITLASGAAGSGTIINLNSGRIRSSVANVAFLDTSTGTITFGTSAQQIDLLHRTNATSIFNIGTTAANNSASGTSTLNLFSHSGSATKFINIGAFGTGSVTIVVGTTSGTSNITINGTVSLSTALTVANGGTGATTFTTNSVILGNGTSAFITTSGTADQILRIPGAGGAPAFGAIDLSKSAAVTNQLLVENGGTGTSEFSNTSTMIISGSTTTGSLLSASAVVYSTSSNNLTITASGATVTPLKLKGAVSQSQPLLSIVDSSDSSQFGISSSGIVTINSSQTSSGTTSGALVVTGGLGVGSTSYLSTTNITTLSLTNALAISSGGIGTTTATANYVFAGPTTGSATAPSFRALVANDIPSLSSLYAPVTSGTSILYGNGSGGFSSVTIGSNLTFSAGTLSATDTNTTYTNGTGITLTGTSFSVDTTVVATLSNTQTLANKTIGTGGLIFSGTTSGTTLIKASSTPSSNTLTLPTSTDTIAVAGDIKDASLTLAVSGVGLSGSASFSANTSVNTTFTVTSNATSANTVSTIVSRDSSGNFSAATITASSLVVGSASGALSASSGTVSVGTLSVANGGTGVSSIGANRIMYGNNTGNIGTDNNFTWVGADQRLTLQSSNTTTSNLAITKNNIATNSYLGLQIANNSSATNLVTAQHSPALEFIGHVWNTTPAAADNTARFRQEVQVTSGASPLATLVWKSSVDTGTASFTDRFKIDSSGVVSIPGSLVLGSASGALSASSGTVSVGTLSVSNGGTGATSFTTSKILISNTSSTTGAITTATAMDYSASGQHLTISAQGATVTPLRVVGTTSQSVNLFEVYSTFATALLTVGTTSMNLQPYGASAGNTYGIKFFELAANGSNSVTLKAPDSITSDYSVTVQPNSKSVTILSPTSSDRITMFYTDTAIKFTKVVSVIRGTSATSSWQLYYGTDRTSGTAVFSATQSTTSTTTGNVTTTFANANAAANSFIWLEMSTQTSVTEVHITVFYD